MKEHQRAVGRGDNNNSFAVHADTNDHHIDWGRSNGYREESEKEAINIRRSRYMNLDQGITLDPIWDDLRTSQLERSSFQIL